MEDLRWLEMQFFRGKKTLLGFNVRGLAPVLVYLRNFIRIAWQLHN